jgi:hypothetical protein
VAGAQLLRSTGPRRSYELASGSDYCIQSRTRWASSDEDRQLPPPAGPDAGTCIGELNERQPTAFLRCLVTAASHF